jgi:alpha/beta superfamily hydrolase
MEKILIPGPAGALEALLDWDAGPASPPLVALVCHPHPVYSGTMHNKVVYRAAKAAAQAGLPALRFNFRGVGESEGEFAKGIGERDDARAALDFLETRFPKIPICLIGFSFGAWVGLPVGAADPRVVALVGLGLAGGAGEFGFLHEVRKPKLIVQGTHDIYGPREQVEAIFSSLQEPKQLKWVEGADHFFTGRLDEVQSAIRDFLRQIVADG